MRGMSAEGFTLTRDALESAAESADAQQLGDGLLSVSALLQRWHAPPDRAPG